MKKAKIAFVIPTLGSGGAERVVSTLSNILCNSFEVHIICLIKTKPFYKIDDNVNIHHCLAANNDSPNIVTAVLNNVKLIRKINSIIKKNDIDILLGFLTSANVLSVIAGKLQNIPVIISERNNLETPDIVYHPRRVKVTIAGRTKVTHPRRAKVTHL